MDELSGIVPVCPIKNMHFCILKDLQTDLDVSIRVVPVLVVFHAYAPIACLIILRVSLLNHKLGRIGVLQIGTRSQVLASLGLVTDFGSHSDPECLV